MTRAPNVLPKWFRTDERGLTIIEGTAVFSVLIAFMTGLFSSFCPGFGVVVLMLQVLLAAVAVLLFLVKAVVALAQKRGKAGGALLIAALIIGYVDIFPSAGFFAYVGDYVHLALQYPYYISKVRANQVQFPWGISGMVGTIQTERTLVFDADKTLESKAKDDERKADGSTIFTTRTKLFGHFYVVEMTIY